MSRWLDVVSLPMHTSHAAADAALLPIYLCFSCFSPPSTTSTTKHVNHPPQLPFDGVDVSWDKKFTYLDTQGRPVLVLRKTNTVPGACVCACV